METESSALTPSQQGLALLKPDEVVRFLANPRQSGIRSSEDITEKARTLGVIYDAVIRLMQVNRAKLELYYPTDTEVFEEIEARRRAVSDRASNLSREDMLNALLLLAELQPPAIYLLREFGVIDRKLRFTYKIVAGDEAQPNRAKNGVEHVLRNSIAMVKSHLIGMDFSKPLQEKVVAFRNMEDIGAVLRQGRLESILSDIYIRKSELPEATERDRMRMQKVNHQLRELILRPLLLELTKSGAAVRLDLTQCRRDSARQFGDPILPNNATAIRMRCKLISDLILKPACLKAMESILPKEYMGSPGPDEAERRSLLVAQKVIEAARTRLDLPDSLVEVAAERVGLESFLRDSDRKDQISTDRDEMQRLLMTLKQHKGIFRAKQGNRIQVNDRILDYITRGFYSGILVATDPPLAPGKKPGSIRDFETIYFLLRDREATAKAIEQAEELFNKVEDVLLVRALEQMTGFHERTETELKEFIAPAYLDRLRELVATSYTMNLPLLKRFWLSIKGLMPDQKMQKQLWEEYLARSRRPGDTGPTRPQGKTVKKGPTIEGGPRPAADLDDGSARVLAKIVKGLEVMWEKGHIPNEKSMLSSLHNREDRASAEKILTFLRLGAASVRDIVEITVPNQESLFASRPWLEKNSDALRERYQRRLADFDGIETKKGVKLSIKNNTEKEQCKAILSALAGLGITR